MKLKIHSIAVLLVLALTSVLTQTMEQAVVNKPSHRESLSLKFQAAQKAYLDFKNKEQSSKNINVSYYGAYLSWQRYLKKVPAEIKDYVCLFEPLNREILNVVRMLCSNEIGEKKHQATYAALTKKLFKLIDTDRRKYKWRLLCLRDLNNENYTFEEKNSVVHILLNKPAVLKDERLALTPLLQKAIKNRHVGLVYFLASHGAYLNKPDDTDECKRQHISAALTGAIILGRRVHKKSKKKRSSILQKKHGKISYCLRAR